MSTVDKQSLWQGDKQKVQYEILAVSSKEADLWGLIEGRGEIEVYLIGNLSGLRRGLGKSKEGETMHELDAVLESKEELEESGPEGEEKVLLLDATGVRQVRSE